MRPQAPAPTTIEFEASLAQPSALTIALSPEAACFLEVADWPMYQYHDPAHILPSTDEYIRFWCVCVCFLLLPSANIADASSGVGLWETRHLGPAVARPAQTWSAESPDMERMCIQHASLPRPSTRAQSMEWGALAKNYPATHGSSRLALVSPTCARPPMPKSTSQNDKRRRDNHPTTPR